MKTIKLIFSIALIALVTSAFGQRAFNNEERKAEFINVSYTVEQSKIADKVNNFLNKFNRSDKIPPLKPIVCMSFIMDQPEIIYEESYATESWMAAPFGSSVLEADLNLEAWMSKPFYCNVAEADLPIEPWMTTPFGAAGSIEVESWMTATWN